MTQARRKQVCLDATPYYHCTARCVRRAFLCGKDAFSGKNYEHRRQWVVDRLKQLAAIFAVDIPAYAVMSNHYHVILRVDSKRLSSLSNQDVIDHWTQLFKGPLLVQRWQTGEALSSAERHALDTIVDEWRSRLGDISWFMRCLNEYLARKANAEDNCKGRFWEGRFKSQALLDERALLSCMCYVDLNPVRADMAKTPETSDFTSVQERLIAIAERKKRPHLTVFLGNEKPGQHAIAGIHFHFEDYLSLVDWTGRAMRDDKKGRIANNAPPILQRLGCDAETWLNTCKQFKQQNKAAGAAHSLQKYLHALGQKWIRGQRDWAKLYPA